LTPPSGSFDILSGPGKVAVQTRPGRSPRLAVADTGHDRVVVCDVDGRVEHVFGMVTQPQGVRFADDHLIVCDTGADRVLSIPLDGSPHVVLATDIASPWDVVVDGDGTYVVTEAARHRLWRIGRDGAANVIAGTGEENLIDGPAEQAILAQPSGLARIPGGIAFVDAEASALRVLTDDGRVETLVGQGLFDWGASDGGPDSSALQHPLGVAAGTDGTAYVADTFNSMIRAWSGTSLTAAGGALRTLAVDGLEEPGGLDVLADGRLVIADTGHDRVVIVEPATGAVQPLIIDESWLGTVPGDPVSAEEAGALVVPYDLDAGAYSLDFSSGLPVSIEVSAIPASLLGAGPRRWELDEGRGQLDLAAGQAGSGVLVIEVEVKVCDDQQCTVLRARTRHDLAVTPRQ